MFKALAIGNIFACLAVAITLLWMVNYSLSLPDVTVDSVTGECLGVTFSNGSPGDCNEVGYSVTKYNVVYSFPSKQ